MSIKQEVIAGIVAVIDRQRAVLRANAEAARSAGIAALRRALVQGVGVDSPQYPVCALVAQHVTIGRADGYPKVVVPDDIRRIAKAAALVGIIDHAVVGGSSSSYVVLGTTTWHDDLSGVINWPHTLPESSADYKAWEAEAGYATTSAEAVRLMA